jgi:outer membrane biogenesis lipoprotein LolB
MNRIVLTGIAILLLFGCSLDVFSNPVDMETAKRVALNFK